MENFNMLYNTMRDRHKNDRHITHCKKKSNVMKLFVNEFRAVIVTVLVVVGALSMQKTLSEMVELHVKSRFKNVKKRITWMFVFNIIFILLSILILLTWKPMVIEAEEDKPTE